MDDSPKGGPAGALSKSERRRFGFPPTTSAEPTPKELEPDNVSELKRGINDMIWRYGPGDITLTDADHLACKILDSIINGKFDA